MGVGGITEPKPREGFAGSLFDSVETAAPVPVSYTHLRNKMDFFRWNPDRAKRQGAEVKPAVESRTQVDVNSEGKTVAAVKGVKEPLKQGQQEATPTQTKNYRSSKKSNSKGVKV